MSEPDHNPTDAKVKQLRERAMDLVADAAVHAQRLDRVAQHLGITPELADGIGDHLYDAAVAQLEVVAKVLERSQGIADRLLSLADRRREASRYKRIDADVGTRALFAFTIRNSSLAPANVQVTLVPTGVATSKIGQPTLPGHRETSIEIALTPPAGSSGSVIALVVQVGLQHEDGRRHELPAHELEIWVR